MIGIALQEDGPRRLYSICSGEKENEVLLEFEADGFLYKMVRNIVGTLLEVGRGKLPKGSIKQILAKKDRNFAGSTAKSMGLVLLEVRY